MSDVATYPLRMPRSLKAGIERLAKREGTILRPCQKIGRARPSVIKPVHCHCCSRKSIGLGHGQLFC